MEAIFELLMDTAAALRARGSKNYDAMLVKIHVEWRHKLNYLLQYGAAISVILFGARRGGENMRELKKADFLEFEDPIKKFKYIKEVISEKDKNHKYGTSAALNGVIPFVDFSNPSSKNKWNPGKFFSMYLDYLPDGGNGLLFPQPKPPSNVFKIHSAETVILYQAKMPGGL